MIRGLYTSAQGMLKETKKFDLVSNNLANISTSGYKKDLGIDQTFKEALTKRINDIKPGEVAQPNIGTMRLGSDLVEVYTDFSQGALMQTDNQTDISIRDSKNGFFSISVEEGENTRELYTKNGAFTLDSQGYLVTQEGDKVVGNYYGSIYVGSDSFIVQDDGSIYVDDQYIDTLKLVEFNDNASIKKVGNNLWEASDEAQTSEFTGKVVQGFIERSNVNSVEEMVKMINLMRSYEANQKIVKAYDESLDKAVNQVGQV